MYLTFTAGSVFLCGVRSHVVVLGLSVRLPCVVGAVTVMRVLLFVWDVSILRE